jgi:YD repeat-containing protein
LYFTIAVFDGKSTNIKRQYQVDMTLEVVDDCYNQYPYKIMESSCFQRQWQVRNILWRIPGLSGYIIEFILNGLIDLDCDYDFYYDYFNCVESSIPLCETDYISCASNFQTELEMCNSNFASCYAALTPNDQSNLMINMQARNMVSPIIEKSLYLKKQGVEKLVSSTFTEYGIFTGDQILPLKVYQINSANLLTDFSESGVDITGALVKDNRYEEEIEFLDYDEYGNILSIISKDGILTTYTWEHNGQYLKSKTIAGDLGLSLTESWDWYPLIGMKSHTDQTGLTTTYEYDTFGRLKTVKNNKGEILQHNEYHYKQ